MNLEDAVVYDETSPMADEMITLNLLGITEEVIKEKIGKLKQQYISLADNYTQEISKVETKEELEKINNRLNEESNFFKYV